MIEHIEKTKAKIKHSFTFFRDNLQSVSSDQTVHISVFNPDLYGV